MIYHVNDQAYPLRKGDGIFVNTNRLHFGSTEELNSPRECNFICLRLHPSLLCVHPYIENHFINPLLYDSRFDVLLFPAPKDSAPIADWRTQALERITGLAKLTMQSPDESALEVQGQFYGPI
jgi:hypothetical protein